MPSEIMYQSSQVLCNALFRMRRRRQNEPSNSTDTTWGEAQVDLKPWHTSQHTHTAKHQSAVRHTHTHSTRWAQRGIIQLEWDSAVMATKIWSEGALRSEYSLHRRPYNTCWSVSIKYSFIPATQGYFFQGRLIVVTLFAKVNISQVMFMFESRGTYYKKTKKDIEHFCCYCPGENCEACCHNITDIKLPITGFIAKLKHNNYWTTIIERK